MTVPSTTRRAGPFTGNGVTTSFPFAFKVFGASDIALTIANASGVAQSAVLNQDYLVTLNPDQTVSPGGSVQYAVSGVATALPTGYTLAITGSRALAQTVTLPTGGAYQAAVVEAALDSLEMQIQQIDEQNNRALILSPLADTAVDTVLPAPEANALLGWNDDASALQNVDPATMAAIVAFGTANADTFTGDGVTTAFTLSASPGALANLDVSVDGVTQTPVTDYTWAGGTTLTFTSPPASGAGILVRYMQALPQGTMDAAAVTFAPGWTGSATRDVQGRLRETMSVLDFAGAQTDGVSSSQSALVAAVAEAFATGNPLYWPDYDFISTATIPNLHAVRHLGPGRIKRGTDLFYPGSTPGVTNILYLSPSGSDTNDGLTASQPRLTTQAALNLLYVYPQGVDVLWQIKYAVGTYTESANFLSEIRFPRAVQLLGAPVADGTQPTTIVVSASTTADCIGFQGNSNIYIEDIFYKNASGAGAAGVSMYIQCSLVTRNVWADNCYVGIFAQSNSVARIRAGKITNCTYGCSFISNVTYTVGYQGTAADINGATGTSITGCQIGVNAQENSAGHIDYTYIGTSAIGLEMAAESRVHLVACNFQSNVQNGRFRGNNNVFDNSAFPTTWGAPTGGTDRQYLGGSYEMGTTATNPGFVAKICADPTTTVSTTAAVATSKTVYTFKPWMLHNRGSGFKVTAFGDVAGVTGTKIIEFKLGGVSIGTKTILAASADWRAEAEMHVRTATNDLAVFFACTETSAVTKGDYIAVTTVNLDAGDTALTVEVTSNGTDTMRLRHVNADMWTA